MEFSFEAKVVLRLEQKNKKAKHVSTEFNLDVSKNLNELSYIDKDKLPTKEGSKVLSNVLVQGLIGNIHFAHEKGLRDSAEHLRWMISELERGFIEVVEIEQLTLK